MALGTYVVAMFALGATESWRMAVLLALLSALVGSCAAAVFHVGALGMFATQLGLFLGVGVLRLLAAFLLPRPPGPAQVSATYRGNEVPGEGDDSAARRWLAIFVFIAIVVAPFAIALYVLGPIQVSEDFWIFMMLTGVVGIALVFLVVWPILGPALKLAWWASRKIARGNGDRP